MVVVPLTVAPYLALWAKQRYPKMDEVVLLPRESLVLHVIINRLQRRPRNTVPSTGNLLIGISEKRVEKDLQVNNWLKPASMTHIERLLRMEFDMVLHDYMDKRFYREGIDYEVSAHTFHEHYNLGDTITDSALLKKHVRYKHVRLQYRRKVQQTELVF